MLSPEDESRLKMALYHVAEWERKTVLPALISSHTNDGVRFTSESTDPKEKLLWILTYESMKLSAFAQHEIADIFDEVSGI